MVRFSCSTTDGNYSFSNCQWSDFENSLPGSCIYLDDSSSSLIVEKCSFTDCTVNKGCGGAIFLSHLNKVKIVLSSFLRCNILSAFHHENGGGGVFLEYVSDEVIIHSSSFLDSSVPHDAGGADMWYCNCTTGHTNTFNDCKFIKCIGADSDGGGIMAWLNTYNVGISNTLFAYCSTALGGGIRIYVPLSVPPQFITFCFFDNNSGTWGHDVCVTPELNDSPLLHCFSTKDEKRLGYWTEDNPGLYSVEINNNWLP